MVYSARYSLFAADKREFFAHVGTTNHAKISSEASQHSYRFLAENKFFIEQEFNHTFAILKDKGNDREAYWLYCYYCCIMLQKYYSKYAYDKPDQAEKYRKLAAMLSYRCEYKRFKAEATNDDTFIHRLNKHITADLSSLVSTPQHTTKIRDWLGFVNIYRLLFVFSRLAVRQSLVMAKELLWFEKLGKLLGRHIDVDGMIAIIKAPTDVFNVLSVGLFAARFILNTGVMLKHTFAPSHNEKSLKAAERLYQELIKRHCVMLNDFVWSTINLLSNYSAVFNISASVANGLTALFLIFDVSLLIYRQHLAEQEYMLKRAQYISDKKYYEKLFMEGQIPYEEKNRHHKMLDEQLMSLEINWQATKAGLLCNLTAALLLTVGFSAALLMASPAGLVVSYLICTIAVATYLSADFYGKYAEKSIILQKCKLGEIDSIDLPKALSAVKAARNDFIMSMFKNTFMPLLIVTTFAVCWPAALLLTALYIGYECTAGYFKRPPEKMKVNLPASVSLVEDDDMDKSRIAIPMCG